VARRHAETFRCGWCCALGTTLYPVFTAAISQHKLLHTIIVFGTATAHLAGAASADTEARVCFCAWITAFSMFIRMSVHIRVLSGFACVTCSVAVVCWWDGGEGGSGRELPLASLVVGT
jgi:hypothetical protein